MSTTPDSSPATPPSAVLTADQVAELLGVNRKTVYAAVERGEIPHRRLGARVLFSRAAIMRWLDGGKGPRR